MVLVKRKVALIASVLGFGAVIFTSCVLPQTKDVNRPPRSVTVRGTGTVRVQADIATINFSVITTNRSVIEATRINSETVASVRRAIIEAGYGSDSIITDNYTITQDVSYRNGNPVSGDYRVTNSIHIVVKNVNNIGNVIDTAVNAGANHLSSIEFSVTDMDSAIREARTNAVKQAYEAANLMVKTAGAELGAIVTITEQRSYDNISYMNTLNNTVVFDEAANDSTSVTPGKQKITVTVECTYEIQ